MLIMFFLMLLVFGVVHMSMLLTTKQFVNYAAFAAARTYMTDASALSTLVTPPGLSPPSVRVTSKVRIAAQEAMAYLDWWNGDSARNAKRVAARRAWPHWTTRRRDGLTVTYHVPFGLPFQDTAPNGVAMTSFAPTASQSPAVPECGDNATSALGQFIPCPIGYYQVRPVLAPGPSTGP